ncbi:hypothetical protein FRC18_009318 [Serendipita sp. 400]|nr:hypothetical protein FRC18_009318 [Serendipita sp. 400]
MPTFAELRAKAEAAAVSAKETANSKVADYRGDKKPEQPESKWTNYKPPPLKPAGASTSMKRPPPVPSRASIPTPIVTRKTQQVQGYEIEVDDDTNTDEYDRREVHRGKEHVHVAEVEEANGGLKVLLEDKAAFFQFMDEFFASRGFNVASQTAGSPSQQEQSLSRPSTPKQAPVPQRSRIAPHSPEPDLKQGNGPSSSSMAPQRRIPPPISPRPQKPVDKKIIQLIHEDYDQDTKENGDKRMEEFSLPPPPRRTVSPRPIASHPDINSREGSIHSIEQHNFNLSSDKVPSRPSSPPARRPSVQIHPVPTPPPIPRATRPMASTSAHPRTSGDDSVNRNAEITRNTSIRPSTAVLAAFGNLQTATQRKEADLPPNPATAVRRPSVTSSPPASPPPQQSPRTPKPVAKTTRRSSSQQAAKTKKIVTTPPPFFTSFVSDENWTPSLPFGYMPRSGGKMTDGQCSAAQLCSYFAKNVEWDMWYASEDGSARPVSIIDRIEAKWRGSTIISQETKKRLFGSGKTTVEKTRIGVVIFQDLSIAWYRVTWKDDDPIKSLKREARYRAVPGPWEGDKLYAAHLQYGQALAESVEHAIQMRQFVGGGEARDLISGTVANVSKTRPNVPPIMPSIGHCHGHLIYEGYIFDGGQRAWGFPRGGETAIRNGDIIEWCDSEFQITDDGGQTTVLSVGESGYTSLILSAEEFPSPLASDSHCLPPHRLPALEIAMQSAASNQPPHVRTVHFNTMTRGRIWIFRCVGWNYLGVENGREPEAEWPPPDPTLFLPE